MITRTYSTFAGVSIALRISPAFDLVPQFAAGLGATVALDAFTFPPEIGVGYHQGICLPGGLHVYLYDFTLHRPLTLHTVNQRGSGTYCIFLNTLPTPIQKTIGERQIDFSRHGASGIFFYSPQTEAHVSYAAGERYVLVALTFTRDTIAPYLTDDQFYALLAPQNRFAYFLEIDLLLAQYVNQLFKLKDPAGLNKLFLHGQALLFVERVLAKTRTLEAEHNVSGLLEADIRLLFKARELLTLHYDNPPTIPALANEVGMSETRLKKHFKQAFGKSVYQYAQYARMLKAKELLDSRQYNVSEVGLLTGYQNMTHFAEVFKKHFELNPSQYLALITAD